MIVLAGVMGQDVDALARNTDIALAAVRAARVAGTDNLFQIAVRGPVTLDQFGDGTSPRRSYIGPVALAQVLLALCDSALSLPRVLHIAHPVC